VGDRLELIGQGASFTSFTLTAMHNEEGEPLQVAHANQRIVVPGIPDACRFDLIRREKTAEVAS